MNISVNKRLIMLAMSALVLAFLANQVINLAQSSMYSSLQTSEVRAFIEATTASTTVSKVVILETTVEKATGSTQPTGEEPGEAYKIGEEQEALSLPLNIMYSLIIAIAVFLLIKRYSAIKLK